MSMVRIVTRIIPSNAPQESLSHLLTASDIDTPLRTEVNRSEDTKTGNVVVSETTFCNERPIPPNVDLDNAIASSCNSLSSLVCLKKSRLRLTCEPTDPKRPIIRVSPEVSADGTCGGFHLTIPLRISRRDLLNSSESVSFRTDFVEGEEHVTEHCGTDSEEPNQNTIVQTSEINPEASNGKYSTFIETMQPLKKYFKGKKCLLCSFVSESKLDAKKHLASHVNSQSWRCNPCDKTFDTPLLYHYHKLSHKKTLLFPCDKCGKKFDGKRKLIVHMKCHDEGEVFECPYCQARLKTHRSLKKHVSIHTGELPYQCSRCPEKFRTLDSLRSHTLSHKSKKLFDCEICGKGYNSRTLFEQHCKAHNGEASFKCDECDKTFIYKSNLLKHSLSHSDPQKYACRECGIHFKSPQNLEEHLSTHNQQDLQDSPPCPQNTLMFESFL